MVATFVMVAALAGGYDPVADLPVHKTPGPAFKIPCKLDQVKQIDRVQLFVSNNRGKTWTLCEEITPDKSAFTFVAKKPGEYWFTARLKKKDGSLDPVDQSQFVVMQRVAVETGTGGAELPQPAKPTTTEIAKELDEELTRIEIELIRKEIKRLSEAKKLTPETEEKIDRLRARLGEVRSRLEGTRDPLLFPPPIPGPAPDRADDKLIPPPGSSIIPTAPNPAPFVAPMPRIPAPR